MRYVYAIILFTFSVIAFFYSSRVFYNRNHKKLIFLLFSLTAFASGLWSLGYGCMLVITTEERFILCRAVGVIGLFLFLILAEVLMGVIGEYSRAVFWVIGVETIVGAFVCFLALRPGSVILENTPNGVITHFVRPTVSIIYTAFTLIVALGFIGGSIYMLSHKFMTNIRVFGRNLLIIEGLILLGMVVDTVLPAMGINYNIPASTMMQFIGLDILYHAIHKNLRNVVNLQNLAAYANSSIKMPIFVFDMQNRLTVINQEAREIFGLTNDDLKRTDLLMDAFGMENPYGDGAEIKAFDTLAQYTKAEMYCHIYIDPILNDYGDYIGYIVTSTDVTAVHKYTQELTEAKNEALRANIAKSQFLANMSHEIRTPMNSILGFSELCLQDDITDASREYVMDIRESAQNLLAIINDILDISKIESGKMELTEVEYNPGVMLTEVNRIIGLQAEKKDLYFKYEIDDNLPNRLKGDRTKLRAILINLLNNAVKYTNEGGVSLKVEFVNLGGNSGRLKLTIRDTGIGIKEEDLDSIFEVFQRVDQSSNSTTEGTGLGLSITKAYLDLMHGSIKVSSEYGVGTTFTVVLEQRVVEYDKPNVADNGASPTNGSKLSLKGINILAVDDVSLNLKLISIILNRYGAIVTTADSGSEAIALCRDNEYDIVLMDHMMPEMDGVMAMREIRKLGKGYEQGGPRKIIVLTANVVDGAKDERLAEGFDDFLGKPINIPWFEVTMAKHLGDRSPKA